MTLDELHAETQWLFKENIGFQEVSFVDLITWFNEARKTDPGLADLDTISVLGAFEAWVEKPFDLPGPPASCRHQQRVVDEKRELDEKLSKLDHFLATSTTFANLPETEQSRMRRQSRAMHEYSDILGERIAAFGGEKFGNME